MRDCIAIFNRANEEDSMSDIIDSNLQVEIFSNKKPEHQYKTIINTLKQKKELTL